MLILKTCKAANDSVELSVALSFRSRRMLSNASTHAMSCRAGGVHFQELRGEESGCLGSRLGEVHEEQFKGPSVKGFQGFRTCYDHV